MGYLASPKVTKEVIEKYGLRISKNLGQNFLIDDNIIKKIIKFAQITEKDYVLEIGPGIGTLTQELCQNAKSVLSVEIDKRLIPVLQETLGSYKNFKVINRDILKVDINKLIKEYVGENKVKVVANLPYYITTPIIMDLLEKKLNISNITVMMQKEVAQRINANPGCKDYGALTVATRYYATPKIGFVVSPNCFFPQPKVDSIVISMDILENPSVQVKNEELFFKIVRASFSQRRKTLLNSLVNSGLIDDKEKAKGILKECGLSDNQRGETLSTEQFARLSDVLNGI